MTPAAPTHDYYVTLEVLPTALHDEIKASYRRLALLHHPDKNIGCRHATSKTQLINAAWEVLGDEAKRSEYDRIRTQQKPSSSDTRPRPQPTATPQSKYQPPPRPDTTAQDEARAQAESDRKRREWLDFERSQEEQIRQCQNTLKPLEAEVDRLNAKIDNNRAKLASDIPYAWNVFAFLSKRLSEKEKSEIRIDSVNAENAIRIKQIPLDKAKTQLKQLQDQLTRRTVQEEKRLAAEKAHKASMERLAKERAKEAQRQEWARQQAEWNKAAQEAAERSRQERAKQARESAERNKRERAAWEARLKANQEEAERATQERVRKQAEDARRSEQRTTATAQQERTRRSTQRNRSSDSCDHRRWWDKIEGYNVCAHCARPLFKFAEQCPGCDTIACASCRHILKTGGIPSTNRSGGNGQRRHPRSRRNDRSDGSEEYFHEYDWD